MARQVFLPKAIATKLPKLYSQESKGENAVVQVKFFCPWNKWTWFATEYDPENNLFFGLVKGDETEFGYFSGEELQSIKGPFGLYIERDQWFTPKTVAECRKANA
jgi:hypothetical protein